MFNQQLDPQSPNHLRNDAMVSAWIADYQQDKWHAHPDCSRCGWPHSPICSCGMGSVFGRVRLGGAWTYVDSSNVAYMREFVESLSSLGFHWRDQVYVARRGEHVEVSHLEYFNRCPSIKKWTIPVAEFASIVCAASVGAETAERYQQTLVLLGRAVQRADETGEMK